MNKLNDLQALLTTYNIDILTITESHLYDYILDSEVSPQGYTVFIKIETELVEVLCSW